MCVCMCVHKRVFVLICNIVCVCGACCVEVCLCVHVLAPALFHSALTLMLSLEHHRLNQDVAKLFSGWETITMLMATFSFLLFLGSIPAHNWAPSAPLCCCIMFTTASFPSPLPFKMNGKTSRLMKPSVIICLRFSRPFPPSHSLFSSLRTDGRTLSWAGHPLEIF